MIHKTKPYYVVVQVSPDEILSASKPNDLNLQELKQWPSIKDIVVAMPNIGKAKETENKIKKWGFKSF
ncbi:MAG: hypothetical protein ACTSQE_16850, partial [Candidatus Heimdallarchaeaceae archaeon]